MSMDEAWAKFDEAAVWDDKRVRFERQEGGARKAAMAGRQADKKLDEACELEAAAVSG